MFVLLIRQSSHIFNIWNKTILDKHLKRIRKSESGNPEEDEWAEVTDLSERLPDQILEDITPRALVFEKDKKPSFEKYEEVSPKIKDQFNNVAQFTKLVKEHVKDKELSFKKFKEGRKIFDEQIENLKPKTIPRFDLSKLNFKEKKVEILKTELEILKTEKEDIKQQITHFTNKLKESQNELSFKVEQMDDIEQELERLEKKEILHNEIKTEENALDIIKREISYVGDVEHTKRIFTTVNMLVDLLKSKNKSTQNELSIVKKEFQILKEKYELLMNELK